MRVRSALRALPGVPSATPVAFVMTGRWLGLGIALVLAVVGYNWWLGLTRGARALGQASAMVTLSDKRSDCTVKRTDAKSADAVSCSEVAAYLRDKLHVRPGASVGITVLGKVSPDAMAVVSNDLSTHGFKVAAVFRVGFPQ